MFKLNKTPQISSVTLPFILNKKIYELPGEIPEHKISVPPQRHIDFNHALNSGESTKTIISVLGHVNGLADYLRGSILLAQYAKHFNIHFKMNVSRHSINQCLLVESKPISPKKIHTLMIDHKHTHLNYYICRLIQQFLTNEDTELYVYCNLFYNRDLLTDDIKQYINSFFTFKPSYYEDKHRLFNFSNYNVLHIRCEDKHFNGMFNDNNLLTEIIKLQLQPPTIVISNNHYFKQKLHRLFGFTMMDIPVHHVANTQDYHNLYSTIVEYMALAQSSFTYCFSYYGHGSGFSEQCSILNNVPYQCTFLPRIIDPPNIHFLLSHYEYVLEPYTNLPVKEMNLSIKFIAWGTQDDVMMNSIQSLKNIHMEPYECIESSKWEIIYTHLLTHDFVCVTTHDTIYENNQLFHYLVTNIQDHDILLPREGIETSRIHFKFMFIRSNKATKTLFSGKEDNASILTTLKMKKLPLYLFPTWDHYMTYKTTPYMIQGGSKPQLFQYNKWYPKKLHVCNANKRNLFYQIEGTLRLLALHLRHQLTYVNVETDPYLKEAVQSIVVEEFSSNVKEEYRPFQVVLQDDRVDSTVYQYDGVHYSNAHTLLPNMEIESFKSCLPTLRKAFMIGLPLPTYDRTRINVVCHMDMYYDELKQAVQTFQKYNQYRIILYTKEKFVHPPNTIVYEETSLQTFSDCIHADILLMSFSSLSIAAHLLGEEKQHVVYTTDKNIYRHRLLNKCIHIKDI